MAKLSTDTPKDSRAGTPRPTKTLGAARKVAEKEQLPGVGKTVKNAEKEKIDGKRKVNPEEGDAEEESPRKKQKKKKKKKILLKKRGAEKTVPPKAQPGVQKPGRGAEGVVGAGEDAQDERAE